MGGLLSSLASLAQQRGAQAVSTTSAPPPVPASVPAPAAHAPEPQIAGSPLQGMFADGNSLLRAVIAAEILGPPVAFKEHYPWIQQPNEPST